MSPIAHQAPILLVTMNRTITTVTAPGNGVDTDTIVHIIFGTISSTASPTCLIAVVSMVLDERWKF
jgi:hypothetical protein